MKYLFILGRNTKLSVEEIKSFFRKSNIEVVNESLIENGFLVEFRKFGGKEGENLDLGIVDRLGGVISIGEVLSDLDNIDNINLYDKEKNNFSYVVWDFSPKKEEVSDYLKKRFRSEKLKASEKRIGNSMNLQNGEKVKARSSFSNIEEEYFVFNNYFGKIVRRCNYTEIEKRDMEKPVRREDLSISPRLAKVMINLSEVREDEILVDAFCGIGVILQEALLQNIKVIGIDKDSKAIKGAKENMKWFNFPIGKYMLLNADSGKVEIEKVGGMVSEPDFGETLKKTPTKEKAEEMIKRYQNIMISVLNNMKKYVRGRFVFTSPYIRIGKKRVGADFNYILMKTGLKMIKGFPLPEFRENQVVGREIVVLER